MIDSITLLLHDLEKHEKIVNLLRVMQTGYRKFDVENRGTTLNHEVTLFDDSAKYVEKFIYRSSIQPSSHYKVIFTVNKYKDSIQFSFSIPKYFYGHNIAQAIINVNELDFSMLDRSIEYAIENGYSRLLRYIKTFFDNEFPSIEIDYSMLELKRLDFCYNQIFKSKSDAFEYLELQRNIRKKNMRDGSTKSNNYQTSIMYYNKDYSVKIYHKGSEFEKNDKYELNQINKNSNSIKFDTEYLQQFADKILRYEITIRPSYISYLFNQNIFRKDSKQYKTWYKLYNKIKNKTVTLENKKFYNELERSVMYESIFNDFKNKIDKETNLKMFDFLYYHYYECLPKNEITTFKAMSLMNKFYKEFDILIHTKRRFFFKLSKDDLMIFKDDNTTNKNKFETTKIVPFNDSLYKLMNNKLVEFFLDMKIEQKKSVAQYLKEVDNYNNKIDSLRNQQKNIGMAYKIKTDSKIEKAKIGMILCALETYELNDLKNIIGFNDSTFYKYKAQLKRIGFTKHSQDLCNIPIPEFSFNDYYIETMLNNNKVFVNNFFRLKV